MSHKNRESSITWGIILILLGGLFLLQNFDYLDVGRVISDFWPLILVAVGLNMILNKRHHQWEENDLAGDNADLENHTADPNASEPSGKRLSFSENKILGEIKRQFKDRKIQSYSVSNLIGDIELDFSRTLFEPRSSVSASGVFGDITIRLPQKVNLEIHTNCLGGSLRIFDDLKEGFAKNHIFKTSAPAPDLPKVKINASIVFGDIRIQY